MNAFRGELLKLVGLRATWVAVAVGLLVSPLITFLNSSAAMRAVAEGSTAAWTDGTDAGFQELTAGVIAAIVLGVTAMSSEYVDEGPDAAGGRQITTSLTAVPSRTGFLATKAAVLTLAVAVLALLSSAATLTVDGIVREDRAASLDDGVAARVAGVVVYWVLTALLAYGSTILTRSAVLPLTVLIVNTTVVSVSFLLSKVTSAANYLPDLSGARMFLRDIESPVVIAPLTGGLVMAAWALALLGGAAAVFHRRDA